jgi:pimeloyl-ACP methyl ester carboxylesterase
MMGANADFSPILLIPGLNCSPRLYAAQLPALWRLGSVIVADHRRGETMAEIARLILAAAPGRFRLGGFSMGGYLALEIMRQAAGRVVKLALIDTSARPEAPTQTERRNQLIAFAEEGRMRDVMDVLWQMMVDPSRLAEAGLRAEMDAMADETGTEAFIRQERAIIGRADSRPLLGEIKCPLLMICGETDRITPPSHAAEIASGVSGARLAMVAGSGHMSPMEKPEEIARLLVEFFAG